MEWSADLAYAVGLITTDGSLSKDGRHINLTSKDLDQIKTFAKILGLKNKIGTKSSGYRPGGVIHQIQFGNVILYRFLLRIGLMPNKTKNMGKLDIPRKFFADFLRGHIDGDGYIYSYWDKRWRSSFMVYSAFTSASKRHLEWISEQIQDLYGLKGSLKYSGKSTYQLIYGKKGTLRLLPEIYYRHNLPCLKRKKDKIEAILGIISKSGQVVKLADTPA